MITTPFVDTPKQIKLLISRWNKCTKCSLYRSKCNYVWYRGEAPCDILFIGEAPGRDEDLSGKPFVGASGRLLQSMINDIHEEDTQFSYGITNVVCCIPLQTDDTGKIKIRVPSKEEALACKDRLLETILRANPKLIVVVGKTAKKYVSIPKKFEINPPIFELQHPAYILRKGGKNSLEYKRNYLYLKHEIKTIIHGEKEAWKQSSET